MSGVRVFVVLCPLIWTWTAIGGYLGQETDVNDQRPCQNDQIEALIQRMDKQEGRLRSLEKSVAEQANDLLEKDKRIQELENELTDMKLEIAPVTKSNSAHARDTEASVIRQRQIMIEHTELRTPGHQQKEQEETSEDQRVQIDAQLNGINGTEMKNVKPNGAGSTRIARRTDKRVDQHNPGEVAFSAFLNSDTDVKTHETIIYDGVMTDTGNGYNHGNGIYVVPVSGVYVLTWSTTSAVNSGSGICSRLVVNGADRSSTCADSDSADWESATGLLVTSVNTGDHVYIQSYSTGRIISHQDVRSSFSGWRLF